MASGDRRVLWGRAGAWGTGPGPWSEAAAHTPDSSSTLLHGTSGAWHLCLLVPSGSLSARTVPGDTRQTGPAASTPASPVTLLVVTFTMKNSTQGTKPAREFKPKCVLVFKVHGNTEAASKSGISAPSKGHLDKAGGCARPSKLWGGRPYKGPGDLDGARTCAGPRTSHNSQLQGGARSAAPPGPEPPQPHLALVREARPSPQQTH